MTSPSYTYKTTKEIPIPHLTLVNHNSPSLNQSQSDYFEFATVECTNPISPLSISSNKSTSPCPPASILSARKSIKNAFTSTTNTKQTSVKWFKSKTKPSEENDNILTMNTNISKSKWRPSLQFIYDDTELLPALITFMRKQYNEENILFLITIRNLNNQIETLLNENGNDTTYINIKMINSEITSIFNEYVIKNAPKQVNLSYNCFNDVMSIKNTFITFDLNDKKCIFNNCIVQIETLISTSILSGFYNSDAFNIIASSRILPTPILIDMKTDESYLSANDLVLSNIQSDSVNEYELKTPTNGDTPYVDNNEHINFDLCNYVSDSNHQSDLIGKYMISSSGFSDGYHEWKIKIVNNTEYRQEIGVVSNIDNQIKMSRFGIARTALFDARVIYGCNNNDFYYASYGTGNKERCYKDLTDLNVHQTGWKKGDVIKVSLNMYKGNIKFYLNGKKIRRTLSVEKGTKYYPIVGFV